jgi:Calcineurin-like phosphoesterase
MIIRSTHIARRSRSSRTGPTTRRYTACRSSTRSSGSASWRLPATEVAGSRSRSPPSWRCACWPSPAGTPDWSSQSSLTSFRAPGSRPIIYWGERGPDALLTSHVLIALGDALKEDPQALCDTALRYQIARNSERSPRVYILNQLGILQQQKASIWWMRLCPGAITRMVDEIGSTAPAADDPQLGSILSVQVPRMYLKSDLKLDDEAFVAVHLSDLHVSEHYAFQLPTARSIQNDHANSVVDLLVEDLKRLNLIRFENGKAVESRLDLLVMSGDFVWSGKENQDFLRARDVIEDLFDKTLLGADRLIMVAGNHDLEWSPNERAEISHGDVSSANYGAFAELLRSRKPTEADLVTINSRSGKRKLRPGSKKRDGSRSASSPTRTS